MSRTKSGAERVCKGVHASKAVKVLAVEVLMPGSAINGDQVTTAVEDWVVRPHKGTGGTQMATAVAGSAR